MTYPRIVSMFALLALLAACATVSKAPAPEVPLDEPIQAQPILEPHQADDGRGSARAVAAPGTAQAAGAGGGPRPRRNGRSRERVAKANDEARVSPTREGYINAIQVWPYAEGALYQIYASPGRVTDIMLQEGEELVSVSAGDTVRWIVGDTTSASGAAQRVHVLVKPIRSRAQDESRHHHQPPHLPAGADRDAADLDGFRILELSAGSDRNAQAAGGACGSGGLRWRKALRLDRLRFRYDISGDKPSWRPLRAFDDGERVYIEFPQGIAQGELPPLFVVGSADRRARQLSLSRALLHRRPTVRGGGAALGRRQGASCAYRP